MSKALHKSTNTPRVNSFFPKHWFICSTNWKIACSGECPFWNPNCLQHNKLFSVRYLYSTLSFQVFLKSMEVRICVGSLSLWSVTRLKNQCNSRNLLFSGRVLFLRDKSKMHFNGTNKELKFCWRTLTPSYLLFSKDTWYDSRNLTNILNSIRDYIIPCSPKLIFRNYWVQNYILYCDRIRQRVYCVGLTKGDICQDSFSYSFSELFNMYIKRFVQYFWH